jgi:hypothetical protein
MKKGLISKIIKLCIVVLLPLLAGLYIGVYFYGNYENTYFDYYMEKASDENTEDRLVSYLDYITEKVEYTKENEKYDFYVKKEVSNEHGDLFTLSIVRAYKVIEESHYNKKGEYIGVRDNYYMTYYFAIYNVNYDNVAKTLDPSGEHALLYTELPQFEVVINNVDEDNENKVSFEMTTTANVTGESNLTVIYDYGYSPEKDSKGNKLNAGNPTSMRYYVLDAKSLASMDSKVKVNVNALSNWDEDAQAQIDKVVEFELEDFYNNKAIQDSKEIQESLSGFNKAYNTDIYAAGYTKYVIGRYLWWQVLLAIFIVEIVCGSFVLVWNAETSKDEKKGNKK